MNGQLMSVGDESVQHGIRDGRIRKPLGPLLDRPRTRHSQGPLFVPTVDQLEQVATLLQADGIQAPVIRQQSVDPLEGLHPGEPRAALLGHDTVGEEPRHPVVPDAVMAPTRGMAEGTEDKGLADTGRSGDQDRLLWADPEPLDPWPHPRGIPLPRRGIVDRFGGGRHPPGGPMSSPGSRAIRAGHPFGIHHPAQPFFKGQRHHGRVLLLAKDFVGHRRQPPWA